MLDSRSPLRREYAIEHYCSNTLDIALFRSTIDITKRYHELKGKLHERPKYQSTTEAYS